MTAVRRRSARAPGRASGRLGHVDGNDIVGRAVTCPVCHDEAMTIEIYVRGSRGKGVKRIPRLGGFVCWNICTPTLQQVEELAAGLDGLRAN